MMAAVYWPAPNLELRSSAPCVTNTGNFSFDIISVASRGRPESPAIMSSEILPSVADYIFKYVLQDRSKSFLVVQTPRDLASPSDDGEDPSCPAEIGHQLPSPTTAAA